MPSFLTRDIIDVPTLIAEVEHEGCGGAVLFLGTVRRSKDDGDVEGIDYSAYETMAERELAQIVAETTSTWPQARVAVRHRLGYVKTGEASVAVAVACPHRAEAYEASRYLIEQIKKRAPIWKKEHVGASTRWAAANA